MEILFVCSYRRLLLAMKGATFAAILAGTLFSHQSFSKRFLVQFHSPTEFQKFNYELKVLQSKNQLFSSDLFGRKTQQGVKLYSTQAVFHQSLEHLGMGFVEVKDPADLEILKASSSIASVEEDTWFPLPGKALPRGKKMNSENQNLSFEEESPWGVKAIDASGAWNQGAEGANVKVAVLDTGIDKDHADLKSRFLEGQDFVSFTSGDGDDDEGGFSDSFIVPSFSRFIRLPRFEEDEANSSAPPPYPYFDQHGHGTHVAGTIAAELDGKGVVGVAPKARILMGRVCGRFGCSNFSVLKGINWAIQRQAKVISMSLGGPSNVESQKEALQKAESAGIVAVAASGNDGTNAVSFPAAYSSVIAVGAVDPTLKRAVFSQYGPELDIVAPGVEVNSTVPVGTGRSSRVSVTLNGQTLPTKSTSFSGSPEVSTPLTLPLIFSGLGKTGDFPTTVRGKLALIQRGEIPFADKVKNAIAAGAAGVVIYNNAPGLISGAVTSDGSIVAIPVVMIEKQIGDQIQANLASGKSESATLQTLRTNYAEFQGTSMATPHIAGVVALMLSKKPEATPAQIRSALFKSATPGPTTSENEYGAGVVNASAAVRAVEQGGF